MNPPPPGLRERKKVQTRLALAHAAMRLFEERGYAETTIDDIAAAANVSRRTFFRYFGGKDEIFIVDPQGKLDALHVALAEGPPEEPTIAALRRGLLALTATYFEPELLKTEARVAVRAPEVAAASLAYQVHWEDALAAEVAVDMGVDVVRDPRPRIVAHAVVAIMRAGVATWFADGCRGEPRDVVARTFDLTAPTLEAIIAMPAAPSSPRSRTRRR